MPREPHPMASVATAMIQDLSMYLAALHQDTPENAKAIAGAVYEKALTLNRFYSDDSLSDGNGG